MCLATLARNNRLIATIFFVAIVVCGFLRIHTRVQTVTIGYELGQLKAQEEALLEEHSRLRMELAKLTTKDTLTLMSENNDDKIAESKRLTASM